MGVGHASYPQCIINDHPQCRNQLVGGAFTNPVFILNFSKDKKVILEILLGVIVLYFG